VEQIGIKLAEIQNNHANISLQDVAIVRGGLKSRTWAY
jgi:hypothetical protein